LRTEAFLSKFSLLAAILWMLSVSSLYAQAADIRKKQIDSSMRNASNIVFLLDVSNSMGQDNKMLLLKKSTEELLILLNKKDRLSLISFGNTVDLLYNTTSYSGPDTLVNLISRIRSKASATNINGGLIEAYEMALKNLVKPGINQILLITDGEFELNNYSRQLVKMNEGITLTCVIIGKGIAAEKAIRYITEELKLSVITLVDEEKDVKRLTEIIESQ
jgi:secreted protein with Ig-like and vWFA domain